MGDLIDRKALADFIREQGEAQGDAYDWTLMLEDLETFPEAETPRLMKLTDFADRTDVDPDGFLPAWAELSEKNRKEAAERNGINAYDINDGWELINISDIGYDGVRYWTGRPCEELKAATPWTPEKLTFDELIRLRNKMLLTMDRDIAFAYFDAAGIEWPENVELLTRSLHTSRVHWTGCPEDLRQESEKWLAEHPAGGAVDPE